MKPTMSWLGTNNSQLPIYRTMASSSGYPILTGGFNPAKKEATGAPSDAVCTVPPEMPEGLLVAMGEKRLRSARKLSLSLLGRAATPIAEATTRLRREPSIVEGEEAREDRFAWPHLGTSVKGERGRTKASYIKLVG